MKRHKQYRWTPFMRAELPRNPQIEAELAKYGLTAEQVLGESCDDMVFLNNLYQVNVTICDKEAGLSGPIELSIKRRDKTAVHDWRELQRIKNEICGPEREGFELYPAESRLVDTANQYFLFILPAGQKMQCGFRMRAVVEESAGGTRQRPFRAGERPPDTMTQKELLERAAQGTDR